MKSSPATVELARSACCAPLEELPLSAAEAEILAERFKAIGHPVRLQILSLLSRFGGQVCVCDIEGQFALAQPTISHHLKILRRVGLINCERRGQWYYYFVNGAAVAELDTAIGQLQPMPVQGESA